MKRVGVADTPCLKVRAAGIAAGRASGAPPIFERVGIVGLGLIGGSIALARAKRGRWARDGVDRKDVLERAMVMHAVDVDR